MKSKILLFSLFLGFVQLSYSQADRTRIFYFDSSDHNGENWIYYGDQIIFDEAYLTSEGTPRLFNIEQPSNSIIIPGETYLLKITYMIAGFEYADSCFTTFNYIPEILDPEDPNAHLDNGTFSFSDNSFGFYNIVSGIPYDYEELFGGGDYTEEEIEGILSTYGYYFAMDNISITHIRIEIFHYNNP